MGNNGKYYWMRDCAEEIDRQKATDESIVKMLGYICSFAVLILVVGIMVFSCTDAVVKTAEIQEQHYSRPFQLTMEQQGYADFFCKHNSPAPDRIPVESYACFGIPDPGGRLFDEGKN